MIIRLIEDLPFFDESGTVRIPDGPAVDILHNQIILWMSVTPRRAPADAQAIIPLGVRRFPAVLDFGFNDCFLVNERHLRDWALTDPSALHATTEPLTIHRAGAVRPSETAESETQEEGEKESGKEQIQELARSVSISVPVREGWLWLHRPLPRFRDEMSDEPPERLFLWPGIGDYRIVTGLRRASKRLWRGATCGLCRGATEHGSRAACR